VNDKENNPGPAVFNNTNPTTTVWAGHKSRNWQKHTLVKTLVSNVLQIMFTWLWLKFTIHIEDNQIEDTVLTICLLDRAYTVLQNINSVQKNVYLPLTVTMRSTNVPGRVSIFARMYIQCNVMQFNTLFIIFTLDTKQCPIYVS